MTSIKLDENSKTLTNDNTNYKYDSSCIHKQNVVLDLDETLISGKACADEIDFDKDKEQLMKYKFHNMDDLYLISERPGVQDFLTELFKNYTVSVWTAASKDYALFIIEHVLLNNPENTPKRALKYIFWSDHGSISKKLYEKKPKKLSLLWDIFKLPGFDPYNTIIIDDYDKVVSCQPENAIKIAEFDCTRKGHEHDSELSCMCETLDDKFNMLKSKRPCIAFENTELDKIQQRNLVNKIDQDDDSDDNDSDDNDSDDNDSDDNDSGDNDSDDNSSSDSDDDDDDDDKPSSYLFNEISDNSTDNQNISEKYAINSSTNDPGSTADPDNKDDSDDKDDNDDNDSNEQSDSADSESDDETSGNKIDNIEISKKAIELRKHNIESAGSDSSDSSDISDTSDESDSSDTKKSDDAAVAPIDLSSINVNPELKKAAEQNLQESMQKLKFSNDTFDVSVEKSHASSEKSNTPHVSDHSDDSDGSEKNSGIQMQQKFSESTTTQPPPTATPVEQSLDKNPEQMFEKLKETTKHNFDKGSSHDDDDDDDDGESKVCKKCNENFITYSGKDHCPECR